MITTTTLKKQTKKSQNISEKVPIRTSWSHSTTTTPILHFFLTVHFSESQASEVITIGVVHILRQPKSGIPGPPSLLHQQWLAFGLPPLPLVSFRQHLPDAPFVLQFLTYTFLQYKMGDIHLLGSNLHVIWLCLS